MNTLAQYLNQRSASLGTFEGWASLIVTLCAIAVLAAVFLNFQLNPKSRAVRAKRKSVVETGSMLAFFVGFYLLVRFRVGMRVIPGAYLPLAVAGLVLVVIGAAVNIMGRLALGRNWGNQVIIYEDHSLVTGGIYRLVRHPLYASLVWMFTGAALVFQNWAALLAALFVFLPGMFYRATQEEKTLKAQFPEYENYRQRTGMLFPISMGPETTRIPGAAFAFCRTSLTVILWLALLLRNVWLVALVFFILLLSLILKVQNSPMIQLYSRVMLRVFPARSFVFLDVPAMRFAHGMGAMMGLAVVCAILLEPAIGWPCLLGFCLLKTIAAFGFCPASKLFVCMRNGGCCALSRAISQPPAARTNC